MHPATRPARSIALLLATCVLALAGCGGDEVDLSDDEGDRTASTPTQTTEKPKPATARVEKLAPPVVIAPEEIDGPDLADAAERFAEEHPDQVGDEPVTGPLPETTRAATWGRYDYAFAAFESGSELDEVAHLYREHGSADEPWTVARWIEAGDVTGTCLLPRPLALLWFPEVAKGPECAPGAESVSAVEGGRFGSFDGSVTCVIVDVTKGTGHELTCRRPTDDPLRFEVFTLEDATENPTNASQGQQLSAEEVDTQQLHTATLGWRRVIRFGPVRCVAVPESMNCSANGRGMQIPPEGPVVRTGSAA